MKTIIWDYNGTILNDVSIAVKIENEMLLRRGLKADYTLDDYKSLFSVPMEDYYRQIGYTFENESFHDVGVEFYGLYEKYFSECTLNEGVLDKLQEAKEKGYQNIILSSCEHQALVSQCHRLGIDTLFTSITNTDVSECMYIGDTNADFETAAALGIQNITLVSLGHQSYERLKKLHDHTVQTFAEVII